MLALACLVLAFAQPFLPANEAVKEGSNAVSIFVDNSFSMDALGEDLALLEKAKQRAREIIRAYGEEDRFQVLTHDFEGRHQRLVSQDEALGLIDEISTTPVVHSISQVTGRQQQALQSGKNENHFAYIISDFQKSITDLQQITDTSLAVSFVPLKAVRQRNLSIDSCWFTAPVQMLNQTNTLVIQVTNHSEEAASNVRLALKYRGQEKPVGTLQIPGGSRVTDTVNLILPESGWQEATVSISDYPVVFDDTYFISFFVAEKMRVLALFEEKENSFLSAAFSGLPYFEFSPVNVRNLIYSEIAEYDLIILDDLKDISTGLAAALNTLVQGGGNLLMFPSEKANRASYNDFLNSVNASTLLDLDTTNRQVSGINTGAFVFFDVFEETGNNLKLPSTSNNFKLARPSGSGVEGLLTYRDGSTFLGKYKNGKGNFYLCSAPLSTASNDLVKNAAVFVPMLYKMAISSQKNRQIAYTIGKDNVLEVEKNDRRGELIYRMKGEGREFIPEIRKTDNKVLLTLVDPFKQAGFYGLFSEDDLSLGKYAFNYNRLESPLDYFSPDQLKNEIGNRFTVIDGDVKMDFGAYISDLQKSKQLWTSFLLLALGFLALESLLLRFWKD